MLGPEGHPACSRCRQKQRCDEPGHGRWYVGSSEPDTPGFRTDRCPRSWASDPFVGLVSDLAFWAAKGLGTVAMGLYPPAPLMEAVGLRIWQLDAAMHEKREKERDEREADEARAARAAGYKPPRGRGRGRGRKRIVVVTEG